MHTRPFRHLHRMPAPVRRKSLVLAAALSLALVVAGAAGATPAGLGPPDPQSPNASGIDDLYWVLVAVTGVIFVIVEGALVALDITSPDVDHSWWVPALDGKFDAIPGRTNHTWFKVRRPGTYPGQCGEFCGIQHAAMLTSVQALPAAEFDRWFASEADAQKA